MVLWETLIKYRDSENNESGVRHLTIPDNAQNSESEWETMLRELNKRLGINCDPDNCLSVFIFDGKEGCLEALIAHPSKNASLEQCFDFIKEVLEKEYSACDISFEEYKEISSNRFDYLGDKADDNGYIRRWHVVMNSLGLNYCDNSTFKVEEFIEDREYATLEDALDAGKKIMADASLTEELTRIYSDENEKKYFGNPVHYKICASTSKVALDIVDIMVSALIANKRLCGRRIIRIHDISEGCYDERELKNLFESAQGNTVIIEMKGAGEDHKNFASAYQRVVDYFDQMIEKNHLNTLCIFVEIKGQEGFSKNLISKVIESIRVIDIHEGYGDRDQAAAYLTRMAEEEKFSLSKEEIDDLLEDKKMFSVEEVADIYRQWFKNGLSTHIYKAYRYCQYNCEKLDDKSSAPYDDLQKMIGLAEIKRTVDQIIDSARIRKIKTDMGLETHKASMHMVFTGNPGSAKTTVARLIAQILRKEDILETGCFVECGRADLIAKYVGWTARQVRAKFREAKGGILFIDEAYSLVDDSHSFADEAINTIVQEMENLRDDVIVIFAGYPEKMKEFLDKNEGLKSRIAFHLDFPDYDPEELTGILEILAEEHGYRLTKDVKAKCMKLFESACLEKDFGNGRFVRNLLEQAEMAQSHRLIAKHPDGKIDRRALRTLCAADFDVNAGRIADNEKKGRIGF
ncbi:ATPase family associated with various cellular activities (AAA) [Lachnospiraceae bacterium XBB2008]|nr:ATPase family associated with various cellular activities (AAA) [Lachnospiraceae bacterium XBB2008]